MGAYAIQRSEGVVMTAGGRSTLRLAAQIEYWRCQAAPLSSSPNWGSRTEPQGSSE